MSVTEQPPDATRELTFADLKFDRIDEVSAVVYGAVLSYTFFLLTQDFGNLLACPPHGWNWFDLAFWRALNLSCNQQIAKVLMLAMVTDYMVADFIEARLLTHAVPYEGKGRFTVDLLIGLVFLSAAESAHRGSRLVLVAFGVSLWLSVVWAAYLRVEGSSRYKMVYPACIAATHFAAGLASFLAFVGYETGFGLRFAGVVCVSYVIWLSTVVVVKQFGDVPDASGYNLFPLSIVGATAQRLARMIRTRWEGWGRKR